MTRPAQVSAITMAALTVTLIGKAWSTETPWDGYDVIDMTHTFDTSTIYWPTEDGFELSVGFEGQTDGGYYYASNHYAAADHGGTHLDAPKHFAKGKQAADQVPLANLMGPACVIDVSEEARRNRDFLLQALHIKDWEAKHGTIPSGCIVLMHTGFSRHWPDRKKYMGTAKLGAEGVTELHFPGYSLAAAKLLSARHIAAFGLDTPSVDYGQSQDFIVHRYMYERNIPGLENINNIDKLPATGGYVIGLPMKIGGGSGAPLRIIGLAPSQ